MNALAVTLALLAALANGAASVLQRRAAMEQVEFETAGGRPDVRQAARRLTQLVRRPFWLAGASALGMSAALQACALAVGSLSVVQTLMVSELLFTLLLGTAVFHHQPGGRTWMSFLTLAVGLALFLAAAGPSVGEATGRAGTWLVVGACAATAVGALTLLARVLGGATSAAALGCGTAISFACTAALIKEVTGRIPEGVAVVLTTGYLYAMCCAGLLSLLLLQSTLRAGTLAASQPALTLGDALVSVVLGTALFGERIGLGAHLLPTVLGACLIAAGTVGLSVSRAAAGHWDSTGAPPTTEQDRRRSPAEDDGETESR
ncbi:MULTISPECIES: DMT family transporter [unclassified Streptomyces]|uniref:DMT family transporter n=1 Tax=unclassified Streptomyces TaxID=2593676 RepID=UPI0036E3212B